MEASGERKRRKHLELEGEIEAALKEARGKAQVEGRGEINLTMWRKFSCCCGRANRQTVVGSANT